MLDMNMNPMPIIIIWGILGFILIAYVLLSIKNRNQSTVVSNVREICVLTPIFWSWTEASLAGFMKIHLSSLTVLGKRR